MMNNAKDPLGVFLIDPISKIDLVNKTNLFKEFHKQDIPNLNFQRSQDKFGMVQDRIFREWGTQVRFYDCWCIIISEKCK